jgi:murein DD-endopeptidase MepM/ murein hydrolase activator NlpD
VTLLLALAVWTLAGAAAAREPVTQLPSDPDHVGPVGWPVWPVDEQHPVRGGFLDPRPTTDGVMLHSGVDISVRDDRPEPGHPWHRTHRVYALEGGTVETAADVERRSCVGRLVRVGHFTYSHVDPVWTVEPGQVVREGDVIGWTCKGNWHVHLTERMDTPEGSLVVNPIRTGGRLHPYVDTAPPVVRSLKFTTPDDGLWLVLGGAVSSFDSASELAPSALKGLVEIRASIGDRESFEGWFAELPYLRAELAPYEVHVTLRRPGGTLVWNHVSFRNDVLRTRGAPLAPRYAPGTRQNLPAQTCAWLRSATACEGENWFSLGGPDGARAWDTRTAPNGRYELCVTALDAVVNTGGRCAAIRIAN